MEAIGSLAGGMAHNFNNILVEIMGYSEYLSSKKGKDDPDYKAPKTIHEASVKASRLTQQLLSIGRGGKYNPVRLCLNDVVSRFLSLIEGTFDKSIEIKTSLSEGLSTITGDVAQMAQCLLNLCINARDAIPNGGKIIIETFNQRLDEDFIKTHLGAVEGNYVIISITDTGMGILPEIKKRIFELFFTTKEDEDRTGMGLSIVYGIVNNHRGLITVDSEKGSVCTFCLYSPCSPAIRRIGEN